MFDELVESVAAKKKTNTAWGVATSAIIQVVVVVCLILIPMLYTRAFPKAALTTLLVAPQPPSESPASAPFKAMVRTRPEVHVIPNNKLLIPKAIPKEIVVTKEAEVTPPDAGGGQPGGVLSGVLGGMIGGVTGGILNVSPPPAIPPPPPPTGPIKKGGEVMEAAILSKPVLPYPFLARQTHVQGDVLLHAIINKRGDVAELEIISGNRLLAQTALEMVKQWRYKPTMLNGQPVDVETTIKVTFSLST